MNLKHLSRMWLTLPAAVVVLGCGDGSGLPPRYRVSGTVTHNGELLKRGAINFTPSGGNGRAAGGTIVDGHYSLTTQDPDDGALPGDYKVSVIARESDPSKVEVQGVKKGIPRNLSEAEKKALAAAYPQLIAGKAAIAAKNLIPAKYSSPETSGLTFEVKEQSNTTADFSLKD